MTIQHTAQRAPATLRVNGQERTVSADPSLTLLEILRDELDLTGSKRGCDDGTCGTCTVLVDGGMARACRISAADTNGLDVLTIEGLESSDALHPLQQAFVDADAVQCGFCTPGMILAAKALLDRNPTPTRDEIARALGSNLCRCTGYLSILDAVTRVVDGANGPDTHGEWQYHQRADAPDKVLGAAPYAADLTMPDMLHAAITRSPHPHAEVMGIDTDDARALDGVIAVVTAADVPGRNAFGRVINDQPVLADDCVRQIGDAVAAVAAETAAIAAQAAALVRVDYRLLPPIVDPAAALNADAQPVHDGGNLLTDKVIEWGDAPAELEAADIVIERTYTTPWIEQAYLEPEAALTYLDADGTLIIRTATQHTFLMQKLIAETMGLPLERVRLIPTVVGGAFGAKTDISCQAVAAMLTLKTNRPIKIVYTRAESFASTTKRHPFRIQCRTGVGHDGRLTALQAEMLADGGAYASASSGLFIRAGLSIAGPYHFPSASLHGRVAYTNNPTAGAMRGFGAPQVAFAIESQMDLMAEALGLDPIEFRLRNRRQSDADTTPAPRLEQEASYEATVNAVLPHYRRALDDRQATNDEDGRWRRGIGVASMRYGVGASGQSQLPGRASLELDEDGRVRLFTGAVDLGQGSDTALSIIAADELALPLADISVTSGDTALTPDAGPSTGSRLVYYVGNSAKHAATQLKEAVLATASELLEQPVEALQLHDGRVIPRSSNGNGSGQSVGLAEVAQARGRANLPLRFDGVFDPSSLMHDTTEGEPDPYPVYVTATHLAEVDVDTESGAVRVRRIVAAHDVGRAVFPMGLKGQIEGAVAMGIGLALKESFRPGETTGFKQYRIPTAREMPEVVTLLVESIDPSADLGAKGVAECATVAVAPAIANAIANATGARVYDLPADPARLLDALAGKGAP